MSKKPGNFILEFEKPLQSLASEIEDLEYSNPNVVVKESVHTLKAQLNELRKQLYSNLLPWQKIQIARHPQRPHILSYVSLLGDNWVELHGDRSGADDAAIVGGILELEPNFPVMVIGTEKGTDLKDKQKRNFGMPQPWGYRKALRLFKHAERFRMPILTLVDTPGAYPGMEAESEGQSIAIANNIQQMAELEVPVISIITGEGGSGGALALAVANKVLMLEFSVYSVISPEGCAAILWRTREKAPEAASNLKITAQDLCEMGLIDGILAEPLGGAHQDPASMAQLIRQTVLREFKALQAHSPEQLIAMRQEKFRSYGVFIEG